MKVSFMLLCSWNRGVTSISAAISYSCFWLRLRTKLSVLSEVMLRTNSRALRARRLFFKLNSSRLLSCSYFFVILLKIIGTVSLIVL